MLSLLLTKAKLAAVSLTPLLAQVTLLLAQLGDGEEEEPRSYSLEVGLIMLCVVLGLLITLRSSKRKSDPNARFAAEE